MLLTAGLPRALSLPALHARHRFRWLAIRVFLVRLWRGTLAALALAFSWLVFQLDYARRWRCVPALGGLVV